tara:strand:- start:2779 stop:3201 length:423 start_codon:yes stop_codon:yes gene_type:complete
MKRSASTTLSSEPKHLKLSQSAFWNHMATLTSELAQVCQHREALEQRISKIKRLVRVPVEKDWILYCCTWWKMIMLYHDSPEKQEKIKAFTTLTKQTPNNLEHLYDILIDINGQKHNMDIQYMQRLTDMDKMYEYAKKKL